MVAVLRSTEETGAQIRPRIAAFILVQGKKWKGAREGRQEERKGHFWKRPRRVAKNERTNSGAEEGKGREGAPMQWRRDDDDDDCAT